MDSALVREYVKKKKRTFVVTVILLLILIVQFYYLNCYTIYVPFFCEITLAYVWLLIIVLNFWFYFSGGKKGDNGKDTSESE